METPITMRGHHWNVSKVKVSMDVIIASKAELVLRSPSVWGIYPEIPRKKEGEEGT